MNTNSGFVYVICDESERIKLGKAQNVEQRLMELQVGNAEQLKILYRLEVKDMTRAETSLHRLFSAHHIRGEWFHHRDKALLDKIFNIFTAHLTQYEYTLLLSLGLRS